MKKRPLPSRQTVGFIFLCTLVFLLIAHGYRYMTPAFSHDSVMVDQSSDRELQLMLSRFLQPLYWKLRGTIIAPPVIGIMAWLWLSCAVTVITWMLDIRSRLMIACCCAVLAINPTMTAAHATYLPWVDTYMLAFLLAALGSASFSLHPLGLFPGSVLIGASMGLYQSYFQAAIVLLIVLLIFRLLDGEKPVRVFLHGVLAIAMLLLSLLIYSKALSRTEAATGIYRIGTYNGVAYVGQYDSVEAILSLLGDTFTYPFSCLLHPQTAMPRLTTFSTAALIILGVCALLLLARKARLSFPGWGLLALMTACLPLGMNAVYFISKGMMHTLMIYAFFLTHVFVFALIDHLLRTPPALTPSRMMKGAACAMVSISLLSTVVYANQIYLRRDLEFQSTLSAMTRIVDRIEQTEGYQPGVTPVVILGSVSDSTIAMARPGFSHLYGMFGAEYNYATTYEETLIWYFRDVLAQPLNLISETERLTLSQRGDFRALPAFPAAGCCQMIDGMLVIRLS